MKPKLIKVNCSFCGNEIECPEDMMDSERHACFKCFQKLKRKDFNGVDFSKVHVDIPKDKLDKVMPDIMMRSLMENVFPMIWKECKVDIKEMSKREIAESMFAAGASAILDTMMNVEKLVNKNK